MPAAGVTAAGVTAPQVMNAPSPTEFSNPASTGTVQKCNCLSTKMQLPQRMGGGTIFADAHLSHAIVAAPHRNGALATPHS